MAFNDIVSSVYYLRTSPSLTSGWSEPRELNLDDIVNHGDSQNLVFLSDGTLRFYISNGNSLKYLMWYVDSFDLGVSWTAPRVLHFSGFGPPGINWAHVIRVTDPSAIAGMVAAKQIPSIPDES